MFNIGPSQAFMNRRMMPPQQGIPNQGGSMVPGEFMGGGPNMPGIIPPPATGGGTFAPRMPQVIPNNPIQRQPMMRPPMSGGPGMNRPMIQSPGGGGGLWNMYNQLASRGQGMMPQSRGMFY